MYVFITKDHDIIARGKSREQVFKRLKKSKRVRKDSTIESFTPLRIVTGKHIHNKLL